MPFNPFQDWHSPGKRRSSECTDGQYTAQNGLIFQKYCGEQYSGPASTLGSGVKDNLNDCMDICSVSRPRCWGVTFNNSNHTCKLFGSGNNFDESYLVSSSNVDAAIARASQLASPPPSGDACPYLDNSYQTSSSGEQFVIYCNEDFYGFGDYCPYSLGPLGCPPHADTMADCLEICSEVHPLCKGVSWNPDMKPGYGNCYLKDDISGGNPTPPRMNYTTHSAGVTPLFVDVSVGCPTDRSYTAPNGQNFTIDCYDGRTGSSNFTSTHVRSIFGCMYECSLQTSQGCKAVVFDDSMLKGYDNCYLLNSIGSPNKGTNATFAEITDKSDHSASPTESSKSKAWIAGPVIGGVVFVVLLAVGLLYWHRRRSRSRNHDSEHVRQQEPPLEWDKTQFSPMSEVNGDTIKKHHELQSSTNAMVELAGDGKQQRHELHGSEGVRSQHELHG